MLSSVLGLLLVGIVAYAVLHQGSGRVDPLAQLDKSIPGVTVTNGLARTHVNTPVKYAASPPDGGAHSPVWENCGVYSAPVPNENAVHSLEHGAVWITYRPGLPAADVAALRQFAQSGGGYVLVSPYPGLTSPISLQAWGRELRVQSASDPRIAKFVSGYAQGPQTPEQGAACSGGTSATGSAPVTTGGMGLTPTAPAATPTK